MKSILMMTLPALMTMHAMAFAAEDETGAGEAAPAAAEAPKPEKPKAEEQNGIRKPAEGTKTRRVWDIANELSAQKQRPALRDEVMETALAEGMNRGTIATQYGKWCTFYGVTTDARKAVRADNREAAEAEAAAKKAAEAEAAKSAAAEVEPAAPDAAPAPDLAAQVSTDDDEE